MGLGLLSRFIGAVFLVLLGGLLLLDQALLRANRNQARLDVQSGALLIESFVTTHDAFLDRVAALVAMHPDPRDSVLLHAHVDRMLKSAPGIRRVWATTPDGRRPLDVAGNGTGLAPLPSGILDSVDRIRPQQRVAISVMHRARDSTFRSALISIIRPMSAIDSTTVAGERSLPNPTGTIGLVADGDALQGLLVRTTSNTRMSLLVQAGSDTITVLTNGSDKQHVLVGAVSTALVRLPNGGTWTATATHALTTRSQRWGMWALGVAGILFLAMGLLREQQRALHVAARSVELERLYSDVKRANQAKSEFLANVSHELRTPLNAIVGFVELLRDGFYGDLSPRQVPPVDRIAASATHLRHLVDQVLDIAKIAAGRLEVHTETIVLRPFVLNVASELESLVSEKGLGLSITVGASLPRVRTDPTHLRQILINLIGNAVKYTPSGSVSVRARLLGAPEEFGNRTPMPRAGMDEPSAAALLAKAPRTGIWVALQVIDTGLGIAPGDLARIFDEFEQVNAGPRGDSMQRGTGLGLAISRRLARLLGGEISVESVLGRGSTFTIWLPVSPADLARERPVTGETQRAPAG
ncbi:MAG: HAMP domain-containing sensor histidine kinase [Gemmatimonadaceae bacterium]